MKSREEQREDRRQFENDVFYEVWRAGSNTDRINYDRLDDCYYEQHEAETCASRIIKDQRQAREQHQEQQEEEEQQP